MQAESGTEGRRPEGLKAKVKAESGELKAVVEGQKGENAEKAVEPVGNSEQLPDEAVQPAVAEVPDFFRMDGKNYVVASRNEDGSVNVVVDGKRTVLPAGTDFSAIMPTDKGGNIQYTDMPIERTLEYFVQRVLNDKARAQMIENNRKQAEAALKKFDKEPNVGTDPDAYETTMNKWEADKTAAQAKVDYWNEVARLNEPKEVAPVAESQPPQATNEMQPVEQSGSSERPNSSTGEVVSPVEVEAERGEKGQKVIEPTGEADNSTVSQVSDQVAEGGNTPGQSGAAEIKEPTFTEEVLENDDKRITKYNSRGEVEAVSTERDGKIVSVDSYDDGVLFEHTEYDGNGVSTSVTRYDKSGNVVAESKNLSPVSDLVQAVKEKSKQNRFNVYKAEKTKGAIRKRAEKFAKKLGIKVNVVESYNEVADEAAKAQILEGRTPGWFANGEAYIYMPHIINKADLDKTFVHEVVAHKGLREMMSKEEFEKFLDGVWSMMGDEAKAEFLGYVGAVDENRKPLENPTLLQMREAADEYVASIAEKLNYGNDLNAEEKSIWQKIVDFAKNLIAGKLNAGEVVADVLSKDALTEEDIAKMVLASYNKLTESGEVKAETENVPIDFRARKTYHGSGAQFDKFDHSYMGTGEGNQAFGWGTYVTEVEGIGKQYANATSKPNLTYKGQEVDVEGFENPWRLINDLYEDTRGKLSEMRAKAERYEGLAEEDSLMKPVWKEVVRILKEARKGDLKALPRRVLYTVDIPDDNGSNYLHWEDVVPSNVVNAVKQRLFDKLAKGDYKGVEQELKRELDDVFKYSDNEGYSLYGNISAYLGGGKAASRFLNEMGFVGISYPADGGRAGNKRNYVIFNEDDAQIENRTMFRIAKTPQEFDATQKEAVEKRGIVAPNLNSAVVNVADVPKHDFTGTGKDALNKAEKWANENIAKEHTYHEGLEDEFKYTIDDDAISKFLSKSSTSGSDNLGVHLAVLKELPKVIDNSIDVEIHPDYQKKDKVRSAENGVGRDDMLVHRMYGAVSIDGKVYRAKTTIHEFRDKENKAYDYKITEVELIISGSSTSNALNNSTSVTGAKLLDKVEKSYDKGKFVLEESENSAAEVNPQDSESGIRFRKAQALENFKLTQDNQWDFSLAIRNSIAPGWSDYARVGDMEIRVKEHTPNWDNFEDFETGEARAKKILNVTVGDYNNTDYRRYKGEYEEFVENHPDVVAVDVEIEDGTYLGDALEKIHKALQEKGIDFEFISDDAWVELYLEENNDLSNRTYFRKANENQEIFVSNARKAVEEIKQEKATPQQWLAMIKKNGGLKAGEDKWMGLSEWLENNDSKSLTKQEVLDFVNENAIKIEEVEYEANPNSFEALKEEYEDLVRNEGFDAAQEVMLERFGDDFSIAFDDLGGELVIANEDAAATLLGSGNIINSTRLDYTTEGLDNKREIALTVPTIEPYNESDEVHFGDAGGGRAVAWVRFGETTADTDETIAAKKAVNDYLAEMREKYNTLEGEETDAMTAEEIKHLQELTAKEMESGEKKARVLVIDEIQSKRHQDAREKGYKSSEAQKLQQERDALYDKMYTSGLSVEEHNRFKELGELLADVSSDGVPSAPFEKNWQELAMKRMLRLAAEEGFDKVAWTTGEQQAERYNMSHAVEGIDVAPYKAPDSESVEWLDVQINAGPSSIDLRVDTDGNIVSGGNGAMNLSGGKLSNVVGKELAEKILSSKDDITLQGDGLRIGGEGMKGFYDKMLPSFVSKYTKKWGAKVGTVEMPSLEQNNVMHSVDVTPEMKESVVEGQTMFRFIGKKGAANLDKAEEATTRLDNLNVAREMEAAGEDAKAIKLATGWERGADRLWRYETEDYTVNQDAQVYDPYNNMMRPFSDFFTRDGARGYIDADYSVRLDELINDDELFKAYPELEGFFVLVEDLGMGTNGAINFKEKIIKLNRNVVRLIPASIDDKVGYTVKVGSTLVHEIQHAIQSIEGFAVGSSPEYFEELDRPKAVYHDMYIVRSEAERLVEKGEYKNLRSAVKKVFKEYLEKGWFGNKTVEYFELNNPEEDWGIKNFIDEASYFTAEELNDFSINNPDPKDLYKRTAGEVEARNVQRRMRMTEEERRNSLAEETYMNDVALEEQIFIFDNLGVSASEEYTDELISKMRENAELLLPRLLTEEVWKNEIEGKTFQSPVGPVKLGENQFDKNKGKGREKEFGMIIPTLERPDLIFEEFDPEDGAERQTKYVFAKAFYDSEGNKHVYYADVSVLKDGMEAVTSSHHLRPNQLRNKIKEEHLLWNRFASDSSSSAQGSSTDQNNALSADKGSNNSLNEQDVETRFRKAQETKREIEELDNETMETVKNLAVELNTPVAIVTDIDSIADERKRKAAKRGDKGWFDLKNGVVTIVMPNIADEQDAVETMMHEIVGHRGLRGLLGARYNKFLNEVYAYSPKDARAQIVKRALEEMGKGSKNPMHVATEEYLAAVAERGFGACLTKINARVCGILWNLPSIWV